MIDKSRVDSSWEALPYNSYGKFDSHCPLCGNSHTLLTTKAKIYCAYSPVERSGWTQRVYSVLSNNLDQALFILSDLGPYEYEKIKNAMPFMRKSPETTTALPTPSPVLPAKADSKSKNDEKDLHRRIAELEAENRRLVQKMRSDEERYAEEKSLREENDKLINQLMATQKELDERLKAHHEYQQQPQMVMPGPAYWRRMFMEMPDYD